jgi:hypothetical protein
MGLFNKRVFLNCYNCGTRFELGANGAEGDDGHDYCDRCLGVVRDSQGNIIYDNHGYVEYDEEYWEDE